MRDSFHRQITYLRLSLTDKCNLKCGYCWTSFQHDCPAGSAENGRLGEFTSFGYDERLMSVRAAAKVGISKVRLTGGEPLCYSGLVDFIADVKRVPGIEGVFLTTNGTMLADKAADLKGAGLDGINISLDTLNRDKYKRLTGFDMFDKAMGGIQAALSSGFGKVKVNVVLIGGFNDDEIGDFVNLTRDEPLDVRFIELMPMTGSSLFGKEAYLSGRVVLERCPDLKSVGMDDPSSVARLYALGGAKGRVGLIEPVFSSFCDKCNRLRITYDGYVKPCLHSSDEYSLVGKSEVEMERTIRNAIDAKPREHGDLRCLRTDIDGVTTGGRSMRRIGG